LKILHFDFRKIIIRKVMLAEVYGSIDEAANPGVIKNIDIHNITNKEISFLFTFNIKILLFVTNTMFLLTITCNFFNTIISPLEK